MDRPGPCFSMLVVRGRRAPDTVPPARQVLKVGPGNQEAMERVEKDCEWDRSRAPSARTLFGDTRATAAVLEFLKDTRVGRMLGQIMLAGGPGVEEKELDEIELWAPEEGEGPEISEGEEEDGPGPPL